MGVKCTWKRGWRSSQRWIEGVLWVEELSSTTCTSRCPGTAWSMSVQEAAELLGAMAGVMSAITFPEATSRAA